jgi:imidazolonepropionase-like amidohydrolase
VVLLHDGRILSVGEREALPVPRGADVVDLTGRWIIPGLVDVHMHLQPWGTDLALRWGVTTVRDLHGTLPTAIPAVPAPHMFSAGVALDGAAGLWPGSLAIRTAEDVDIALDSLAASGAHWVGISPGITPELLELIVAGARARRLSVAAHLGLTDALVAMQLGVTSIEHLSGIPEAAGDSLVVHAAYRRGFRQGVTAFGTSWLVADTGRLMQVARDLAVSGVTLVPTLTMHEVLSRLDDPAVTGGQDLHGVPDSIRSGWDAGELISIWGWDPGTLADLRMAREVQDRFVLEFARNGGRLVAGTDAPTPFVVPGVAIHREMELLVAAGLTPLAALRAATAAGADLLRADSLGRLRANAVADLVVLSGDPLTDIRNTRRIERVMLRGVWVR